MDEVGAVTIYTADGRPIRRAPGFLTSFVPLSDGDSAYAVASQSIEIQDSGEPTTQKEMS